MALYNNELWQKPPAGASGFYDYQIQHSAFFDSASSSYMNKTFSSSGNRRTGTLSVWIKRSKFATQQQIFGGHVSNADQDQLLSFNSSGSANVVN